VHSGHTHEGAPTASAPQDLASAALAEDKLTQARALLAEDEQRRMRECATEIEQVLARHGMRLDTTPAQISIVPA
jgi:hypothetical protein